MKLIPNQQLTAAFEGMVAGEEVLAALGHEHAAGVSDSGHVTTVYDYADNENGESPELPIPYRLAEANNVDGN